LYEEFGGSWRVSSPILDESCLQVIVALGKIEAQLI
jgi:hypothetical protein